MRSTFLNTGLAALTVVLLAACGTQPRYQDSRAYDDSYRYDTASSYRNRCDACGTVERIERVQLRDQSSQGIGGGAVLGAIIGGVVGSNVGSGDGRTVATAAGAVAGGVIGHQIQNSNNNRSNRRYRRDGYMVEVSLDDGRWAQVTQLENPRLRVGNRVMIRDHQVYRLN